MTVCGIAVQYSRVISRVFFFFQGRGRKRGGVNKGRDGLGWHAVEHGGNPEVSACCKVIAKRTHLLYSARDRLLIKSKGTSEQIINEFKHINQQWGKVRHPTLLKLNEIK